MGTTALTEAVFYILLSLDTPLHGYGIMQNVEHLSGGRVRLAAGTLYGALATLTERGWIVSDVYKRQVVYCGDQASSTLPVSPWRFLAMMHSAMLRFSESSL